MGEPQHTYGIDDFDQALQELGWKVADFCRQSGLHRNTPSRWRNGELDKRTGEIKLVPIPLWVSKFLGMALEVKRLHDRFIIPPKGDASTDEPDA
ncbi:MAG: hypothetical protein V4864_16130 [Pseudomonadota bacterium]